MILNTHSDGHRPVSGAVGRGGHFTRPERPPQPSQLCVHTPLSFVNVERLAVLSRAASQPDCRAFLSPKIPRTAERHAAPHPQRAAHPFAPVLYQTRHSPAGPKHQHRQEQAVSGSERIHGPRMLMNGETFFHVTNPNPERARLHVR